MVKNASYKKLIKYLIVVKKNELLLPETYENLIKYTKKLEEEKEVAAEYVLSKAAAKHLNEMINGMPSKRMDGQICKLTQKESAELAKLIENKELIKIEKSTPANVLKVYFDLAKYISKAVKIGGFLADTNEKLPTKVSAQVQKAVLRLCPTYKNKLQTM